MKPQAPDTQLQARLFEEILQARQRIYHVGDPTPLHLLPLRDLPFDIWVKREDLGPIKAFKWRGAFNAIAKLTQAQRQAGIATASAGNHAQGVALAAHTLGCQAMIFMPRSTPEVKQREVLRHGGTQVTIELVGDSYDEAAAAAHAWTAKHQANYIHPYNNLEVMGGQGTLADEIVMSREGPFDRVYVAVGGGGLAAGTALWLKRHWPKVKIIGVEGTGQASMQRAIATNQPTDIGYVDVFCDGTAVRKVGDQTFRLCRDLLDEIVTVTNDEVCYSIRAIWEGCRAIAEPSGGLPLAAVYQDAQAGKIAPNEKICFILCGANMDFAQLAQISRLAGIGSRQQRFLRIPIVEGKGRLLELLEKFPPAMSIIDLQYGRIKSDVQYPILGLRGSREEFEKVAQLFTAENASYEDVTDSEDAGYRIINYAPELFKNPLFVNIEFPERARAFTEFMLQIRDLTSLCYFNYAYTGERVGRALIGMEFDSLADQQACIKRMDAMVGNSIRSVKRVSNEILRRLTGGIHQ